MECNNHMKISYCTVFDLTLSQDELEHFPIVFELTLKSIWK